jgi:hypothetical protein
MTMCSRLSFPFVASALLICAVIAGCNSRTPIFDNALATTAPTTLTTPVTPQSNIIRIDLSPGGLNGGDSGRGTVVFDLPIPPEGAIVALRSSDTGVAVSPAEIALPGGSLTADFSFTTQAVASDKVVQIVATTPTQSKSAPLGVWTPHAPMFFSYSSDRGETVGRGLAERYTPPSFFVAGCDGNSISGSVYGPGTSSPFFFGFGASPGTPLRPGTYENASSSGAANYIRIAGFASCSRTIGRFTVHEADFATRAGGRVDRFWVSFEQTCQGSPGSIRGEIRLLNPSPTAQGSGNCLGGR